MCSSDLDVEPLGGLRLLVKIVGDREVLGELAQNFQLEALLPGAARKSRVETTQLSQTGKIIAVGIDADLFVLPFFEALDVDLRVSLRRSLLGQ